MFRLRDYVFALFIGTLYVVASVLFKVAETWYVYGLWPNWTALIVFAVLLIIAGGIIKFVGD